GVRDSEFRSPPKQGDRVFIGIVANEPVNTLFAVADVQPDSHGGSKLILNRVKT
ncbi:head-tail joining protein, partial [Yersinia enterocolitica]